MKKIWDIDQEAANLQALFALKGIKNKSVFAREHGISGGISMLSQHVLGRRPLNLEAAIKYAKGFDVSLEEISPRLASEVQKILSISINRPTNKQALDVLIKHVATLHQNQRDALAKDMALLMQAPKDPDAKSRILAVLENA
jgi:hypothetical protein